MRKYEFQGTDMYVGEHVHIYQSRCGTYWMDTHSERYRTTDSAVLVVDDFGNMVNVFDGAKQRHFFRQVTH